MSNLGKMLKLYGRVEGVGVRQMAKEIGVSPATVSRLQNGKDVSHPHLLKVIGWLFDEPKQKRKWL